VWTVSSDDALGRVRDVQKPGGIVYTDYEAERTTVSDEWYRKRVSELDGLNPDGAAGNQMDTSYEYDVADQLTNVAPGVQTAVVRVRFGGALKSATTPEAEGSLRPPEKARWRNDSPAILAKQFTQKMLQRRD
jgi:hypothetical protein